MFVWIQVIQRMIRAVIELHHYSVDMFLGLCVTLLIWHANVLYYDMPCLPKPLYPHLKKLLLPYDTDGYLEQCANRVICVCQRFKCELGTSFINMMRKHRVLPSTKLHTKRI
jgi:hypothetical protein